MSEEFNEEWIAMIIAPYGYFFVGTAETKAGAIKRASKKELDYIASDECKAELEKYKKYKKLKENAKREA